MGELISLRGRVPQNVQTPGRAGQAGLRRLRCAAGSSAGLKPAMPADVKYCCAENEEEGRGRDDRSLCSSDETAIGRSSAMVFRVSRHRVAVRAIIPSRSGRPSVFLRRHHPRRAVRLSSLGNNERDSHQTVTLDQILRCRPLLLTTLNLR